MSNHAKTAISLAMEEGSNGSINRMKEVHQELPYLLYLLGGSAVNQDFFDLLDELVPPAGKLEGQSKRQPEPEEDIVQDDEETSYVRPNGEVYYARQWTGMQDVKVLRTCRTHNQYPFMYGPPGTGKTALAEAAFGEEVITFVFSGDTEVNELLGGWMPNPLYGLEEGQAEYIWTDGPLTVAALRGVPFLADEIGVADPKVLTVLYSLMDGRREVRVPGRPGEQVVKAEAGFVVIGATNPNAPGVNLSEALLSRFTVQVEVTTDYALAVQHLGVPEVITGIASGMNRLLIDGSVEWAPQMRELLAFRDLVKVFGEKFAVANLIATAPEGDRAEITERLSRHYGAAVAQAARI